MKTASLISIQQEYIETVNAGLARWSHRKNGGHSGRVRAGARHKMVRELARLGFDDPQIAAAIKDASDMLTLERASESE